MTSEAATTPDERVDRLLERGGLVVTAALVWRAGTHLWESGTTPMYSGSVALMLVCYLLGFFVLGLAVLPSRPRWAKHLVPVGLAAVGAAWVQIHVAHQAESGFPLTTDALSYMDYAARLLLRGDNPYLHDLSDAYRLNREPMYYLTSLVDGDITGRVAYPALSILAAVPFVALDLPTRWLYPTCLVISLALVYLGSPARYRPVILVPFFVERALFGYALGGVTDTVWVLLLVLVIRTWRHPVQRAVWFGLACAYKHQPWVIAPFLLVQLWCECDGSPREKLRTLGKFAAVVTATFVLVNAPFIFWAPHAWYLGVTEPVRAQMVSFGQGLSTLTMMGIAPVPKGIYGLFRVLLLAVTLVVYYRQFPRIRELVWLLPAFVLWFGYRSLTSYWYFNIIPFVYALAIRSEQFSAADCPTRPWRWDALAAGGAIATVVATTVVYSVVDQPLRLDLAGPIRTHGSRAAEMDLAVKNGTDHPITPRFTVQSVGTQPFYWEIVAGPRRKLGPGEEAIFRIKRPGSFAGFEIARGGRVTVIDADDGNERVTLRVPGDASHARPDLVPNGQFRYWEGQAPTFWGFFDETSGHARLTYVPIREADGPRTAVRIGLGPSVDKRYAHLDTYMMLPDATVTFWVKRPTGANKLPELSFAYGLRLRVDEHDLRVLFGDELGEGKFAEDVSYRMVPCPEETWCRHELDLASLLAASGIPTFARRVELPRYEHLNFPMVPMNLQLFVSAQAGEEPVAALFGPIHVTPAQNRVDKRFQHTPQREAEAHIWRGDYNLAARNYRKAVEHFRRGLAAAPESGRAHYGIASASFWLSDWQTAAEHFALSVEADHETAQSYKGLGWCRFEQQDYRGALEAWERSLGLFGDERLEERVNKADALMGMALALTKLDECKRAAAKYQQAQSLNSNNPWPPGWFDACKASLKNP